MGRRAHALLLGHMQRHCYSALGALRWKRDVTEYADVLRASHSPATNAQVWFQGPRIGFWDQGGDPSSLLPAHCLHAGHGLIVAITHLPKPHLSSCTPADHKPCGSMPVCRHHAAMA